jgi:hypothetical protein
MIDIIKVILTNKKVFRFKGKVLMDMHLMRLWIELERLLKCLRSKGKYMMNRNNNSYTNSNSSNRMTK